MVVHPYTVRTVVFAWWEVGTPIKLNKIGIGPSVDLDSWTSENRYTKRSLRLGTLFLTRF